MTGTTVEVYDLRGLKCPLPVLKVRRKLKSLPVNAEIDVETTDPLAGIDIPHFCHQGGHTLLAAERTDEGHRFRIRKGAKARRNLSDSLDVL